MILLTLKLNVPLGGYEAGREINVKVDRKKTPIDKFWRARLKDAEIDNCVEIVKPKPKPKSTKKPKESK